MWVLGLCRPEERGWRNMNSAHGIVTERPVRRPLLRKSLVVGLAMLLTTHCLRSRRAPERNDGAGCCCGRRCPGRLPSRCTSASAQTTWQYLRFRSRKRTPISIDMIQSNTAQFKRDCGDDFSVLWTVRGAQEGIVKRNTPMHLGPPSRHSFSCRAVFPGKMRPIG